MLNLILINSSISVNLLQLKMKRHINLIKMINKSLQDDHITRQLMLIQ